MTDWIEHYNNGLAKMKMKRFREALREFRRAEAALDPETSPLLAGNMYMRMNSAQLEGDQYDEAIASARKAAAVAEHHTDEVDGVKLLVAATTVLANLLVIRGTFTDGIPVLEELVDRVNAFDFPALTVEPLKILAEMYEGCGDEVKAETLKARAEVIARQSRARNS